MHEHYFFFACWANASKTATFYSWARRHLLLRGFFFFVFFCRADTPLADLLPLLTFSSKRDWIYNQCGTVCEVYSGHIEQVRRDLDWLLKVKALSTAFFLRISHPCPPDTWHYDTAASFQELPCLSLSQFSRKLSHLYFKQLQFIFVMLLSIIIPQCSTHPWSC